MADALVRQWHMLRLLPRAPRKVDAATLETKLRELGLSVHRRSVQRDLQALSALFPIVCDETHKPFGWSWAKDAGLTLMPDIDAHTAITFDLVRAHLQHALPRTTLAHLEPHFLHAKDVLKSQKGVGLRAWADRVRIVSRSQPTSPPEVSSDVVAAVYEALLTSRMLHARYQRRGDATPSDVELHPLAIVLRDGVVLLVCTFWDYTDVRHLPLHRFHSAEVLSAKRRSPVGFDIDGYLATGELGFLLGKRPLRLEAAIHPEVARTVSETPLAADQTLRELPDGWFKLKATLTDTLVLRGWALSYGRRFKVLKPDGLREDLIQELRDALALYEH